MNRKSVLAYEIIRSRITNPAVIPVIRPDDFFLLDSVNVAPQCFQKAESADISFQHL